MSALRPLPPRPSLAFDRKEAKALLRQLRAGDVDALTRARAFHAALDVSAPRTIKLADAQLIVAREYGFASWPRLVQYHEGLELQRLSAKTVQYDADMYLGSVRSMLVEHRDRRAWAGRALAAYVPRFYGMSVEDVFAATVTEDEARVAVARSNGCTSWEQLLVGAAQVTREREDRWAMQPWQRASRAMEQADLVALQEVVAAHPDLLRQRVEVSSRLPTLVSSALHHEEQLGRAAMQPILEWLASQGCDLQRELNVRLCGHLYMKTERVRSLLERGADARWIAPNGISVLEYALLRYWNGEAADLIAARATPRKALWIAAGLGDIDGVRQLLDRNGKPVPSVRRDRPPFDAVGPMSVPTLPDPDDDELLIEAFFVAVLNNRTAVMEYMVSRGVNVNSLMWDVPLVCMAVGNGWTSVVESLVRLGADLDLRGWRPSQTAREMAREMFENSSHGPGYRRIVELCGMDPDAIIAARDATPVPVPVIDQRLQKALMLAEDDAFRCGASAVSADNLLFGMLRAGGLALLFFTQASRMDRERFHADVLKRVCMGSDVLDHVALPLDADAQALLDGARALAQERRRSTVLDVHLLFALVRVDDGVASNLLKQYGAEASKLLEEMTRSM